MEVQERNRFWGCIYDAHDGSSTDIAVSDIMEMEFVGLPLRIEHNEGDVGKVVDSKTDPVTGRTEICFEMATDIGAIAARQQIDKGIIKQLSLMHLVYGPNRPGEKNRLVPVEVSLCMQGRRARTDVYTAKKYKCAEDATVTQQQPLYAVRCSASSNWTNRIYMEGGAATDDPAMAMEKAVNAAVEKKMSQLAAASQAPPSHAQAPPLDAGPPVPPPAAQAHAQVEQAAAPVRDDSGRFAPDTLKRSYEDMVNETSNALDLDTPEKKKRFMDFAVQSAKKRSELETTNRELMGRVDALGREQEKSMLQTETVVEQVSEALSKFYGNFAPHHAFKSDEFKDEMMKNPVLSRELAPMVVACSNLFQAQSNVTQTKMASEIDNLSKELSFYSHSFDAMGGATPSAAWIPKQREAPAPAAMQAATQPIMAVAASARPVPAAAPQFNDVRTAVGNLLSDAGGFNAAAGGMDYKMPRNMLPNPARPGVFN
jgi:hypothetical protein